MHVRPDVIVTDGWPGVLASVSDVLFTTLSFINWNHVSRSESASVSHIFHQEKLRQQEEQEKARREMEEERLRLQQLKVWDVHRKSPSSRLSFTHVASVLSCNPGWTTGPVIKLIANNCVSLFSWCAHTSPLPEMPFFCKAFPLLKYVIMRPCILLLYCFHIISHNCRSHFLLRCDPLE